MKAEEYKLIPMSEITDEAREIAVAWMECDDKDWIGQKHKLASDIMNYAKKHNAELLRQRDELREALTDMVWQFAYEGHKDGKGVMHTGGLSALESAFDALGISDPITVLDFEAAIKNTEG